MREKVVGSIFKYIKSNKQLTEEEEDKIIYGLESIYILVTKLIIISIIAFLLHILKEMWIFLFIFNIIRTFACGLHATKSYICLIISSLMFIGLPYLSKIAILPIYIKVIIGIVSTILLFKNSPADTYKKPIINMKRRKKLKFISTIISIIFTILALFTPNFISNCLIFSLLLEVILSSPLTYKLFKLPYNNYLNYLERDEYNVLC